MNLVKFKDVLIDDIFNENFKGKYAYLCKMRYAFTFDLTPDEYKDIERLNGVPSITKVFIDIDNENYSSAVDWGTTEEINDITEYIYKNTFTSDPDITIDELKKFKVWLTSNCLELGEYEDDVTNMLNYYKSGSYDDVVKILTLYPLNNIISQKVTTGCSCCNSNLQATLNDLMVTTCDPVSIYKDSIYKCMVNTFSNLKFWEQYPKEFIIEFKKYIDNIITVGLPLTKSNVLSEYNSCECLYNDNNVNIKYLDNLSQALQYIIDDSTAGHKLFINTAFEEWAKYVFEIMEW